MSKVVLELINVKRVYKTEDGPLHVLKGVNMELRAGEIVGLIGPSGSGKSSLLHAAGLLEKPNSGEVKIGGVSTRVMSDVRRTSIRRNQIGFVYQFHHLLADFDALENVAMPMIIAGMSHQNARQRASELLDNLGLTPRIKHQPAQMSGGEQQRVAIARALANKPSVILADEPTGNLDPATSKAVFDALSKQVREHGAAALIATHNHDLAKQMDRVITFKDGHLMEYSFQ